MIIGGIGCGNMGGAVIAGIGKQGKHNMIGYDHHEKNLKALHEACGMEACANEQEVAERSDIILIGVKPYGVEKTVEAIAPYLNSNKMIISMAAGISIEKIRKASQDKCPIVVIMPNTPTMVGLGCCALCFDDERLTQEQKTLVESLFTDICLTTILKEEDIPLFSALLGSGPAFVFYMQEAMQEVAVRLGFKQDESKKLIDQLFAGSAALAKTQDDLNYARLRLNVCSPRGSSIVGVNTLDQKGVRSGIIEAVLATHARAVEMSK